MLGYIIITLVLLAQVEPSAGRYGYYSPPIMTTYVATETKNIKMGYCPTEQIA